LRKGESRMLAWINEWIAKNNANGNLPGIYTRFHG
jgi:polar amino acid transport system substrate-binding protein